MVAETLQRDIYSWLAQQAEAQRDGKLAPGTGKVCRELQRVVFRKVKYQIPHDIWAAGTSQPSSDADEQSVTGVVSKEHTLLQIKGTIDVRQEWLSSEGLPMDFQIEGTKR